MRLRVSLLVLLLATLASLVGCGAKSSGIDWKIDITGAVGKPVRVSYDDLVGMRQTTLQNVLMRKSRGEEQTNRLPDMDLTAVTCDGCTSQGRHGGYCDFCQVRTCGVDNCARCPEYSCAKLDEFVGAIPQARATLEEIRRLT